MLLFREIYKLPLHYIFFLYFIIFFIKFSTASNSSEVYKIDKIELSEKFDLNFNKNKIINKAFNAAFKELVSKITLSSDNKKLEKIESLEIKNLVESFIIVDEKFINDNYIATFEVEFNKSNFNHLLEKNNIFPSIPIKKDMFVIPIFIRNNQYKASLFSENPFYLNWNNNEKKHFLIKYILPNEDIEDINLIRENFDEIENYNFEKIINKYDLNDFIIIVFYENQLELNVLSKLYINKSYRILNSRFNNFNINDLNLIDSIIYNLKSTYEDEWKKINQINSSINLTLTLAIDSSNHLLINKLEKKLLELDLVSNYYIDKFSKKETIYKVTYNNTPDKFIKEITSLGFNLDTSSKTWLIK